jgi:hypothetical protein
MEKIRKAIFGDPNRPLVIGNIELPCYVLDDGTRVLSGRGMQEALSLGQSHGSKLRQFLDYSVLKSFISDDLAMALNHPIKFIRPGRGGKLATGYEATVLVDICDAVLTAKEAGKFRGARQQRIARQCGILTRAFAKVGIIALIDEATGYQEVRDRQALQSILEKFISKDLLPWAKRFPDDFYKELFRLKQWQYSPVSVRRPSLVGKITNNLVYERIAPGVLSELRKIVPRDEKGRGIYKFHQRLTPDVGHPKLTEHLAGIIALMRASSQWDRFSRLVNRAFPRYGDTLVLPVDDPDDQE